MPAAVVLGYLARPNDLLAQAGGFLLMARDYSAAPKNQSRRGSQYAPIGGDDHGPRGGNAPVVCPRTATICVCRPFARMVPGLWPPGTRRLNYSRHCDGRACWAIQAPSAPRPDIELDRTAHNIIQRAHSISANELKRGLLDARRFITRYGRNLLQIDLLQ